MHDKDDHRYFYHNCIVFPELVAKSISSDVSLKEIYTGRLYSKEDLKTVDFRNLSFSQNS